MADEAAQNQPFQNEMVAKVFAKYSDAERGLLLELRKLIFAVAQQTEGVGEIEETLKWAQPSYLTPKTKSGTTIRIDADRTAAGDVALYVNCQTSLLTEWRERYPALTYGGTRSIHFKLTEPLPSKMIAHCIGMALTYHLRKKRKARQNQE